MVSSLQFLSFAFTSSIDLSFGLLFKSFVFPCNPSLLRASPTRSLLEHLSAPVILLEAHSPQRLNSSQYEKSLQGPIAPHTEKTYKALLYKLPFVCL